MNKHAAIYTRSATTRQGRESTEIQEQACRALAQDLGCAVTQVYSDIGASGATADRPGLQALLDAVHSATVHVVVIYDPDRLARNEELLQEILETFDVHGVHVWTTNEVTR